MSTTALLIIGAVIAAAIFMYRRLHKAGRPVPSILRRGQPLPDFHAVDENGDPVRSTELHGTAAVILFVRGNWCPFCSAQVEDLSAHYKDIVDLGARLILVAPKPLETTRRVAEFFEVEFDFWLSGYCWNRVYQTIVVRNTGRTRSGRPHWSSIPAALFATRNYRNIFQTAPNQRPYCRNYDSR